MLLLTIHYWVPNTRCWLFTVSRKGVIAMPEKHLKNPEWNGNEELGTRSQRGFVLIIMAVSAIALVGALGVAVDIGKMFIAKNETQDYVDSAALAAALMLDGTTTGISNAQTAVTNSPNTWNLSSAAVSSPTVTFATSSAGPWSANPNPATGYIYAKVSATVSMNLYFMPVVTGQTSQSIASSATAGQITITSFTQGLAPYSAVATNNTPPNFGLTVGDSYDIQWPQFSNGHFGGTGPCAGDLAASQQAVINNWGSSTSGYWGSTSNSTIEQEILNVIQMQPVSVGTNIQPVLTSGQKQSQANYLDERASEDISTDYVVPQNKQHYTDNMPSTLTTYMSGVRNGRRLLPVPVVQPTSAANTNVVGYGAFLLYSNGATSDFYKTSTNGNDPFCAIYAGPYQQGGIGTGGGGTSGATYVKLVQ